MATGITSKWRLVSFLTLIQNIEPSQFTEARRETVLSLNFPHRSGTESWQFSDKASEKVEFPLLTASTRPRAVNWFVCGHQDEQVSCSLDLSSVFYFLLCLKEHFVSNQKMKWSQKANWVKMEWQELPTVLVQWFIYTMPGSLLLENSTDKIVSIGH